MTATSITGKGTGSAEGPLRDYSIDNIRKVYVKVGDNLLPCIYVEGNKYILRTAGDGGIKIDSGDDVSGYLSDKLLPGLNITFTISAGPNKTLTINSLGGGGGGSFLQSSPYNCLAGVSVNDVVYSDASDNVALADASSIATVPALGVVNSKPSATTCILTYWGELTGFVGLTPNTVYYLDVVAGGITTIAPTLPGEIVQRLGVARNSTTLIVNIDKDFIVL
jgi:hypothetical protein